MSLEIDFKIYKSTIQEKRITELYLGHIPFSWPFAIVKYKADCTEAFPFTPFDKAICGLLTIDSVLSFEEIAEILGFNVIDNPNENKYKDLAEHEILLESLSSLYDFGMIEKGDSYYSSCKLTNIGKEYATKGLKFKTTENKIFSLYFDLFTNDHKQAKTIFQDLKPVNIQNFDIDIDIDFENESFIKTFAEFQIPEIYNPTNGNSFSNVNVEKISFYAIPIYAGVMFDFQLNTFRIKALSNQGFSDYFTKKINESDELKQIVIDHFLSLLELSESNKSIVQENFEELACNFQNDADYLIYQNKPQEAIKKIDEFYLITNFFDQISFWFIIRKLLSNETEEVWISITNFNDCLIKLLYELATDMQHILFFIITNPIETDVETNLYDLYNVYIIFENVSETYFLFKTKSDAFSFHKSQLHLVINNITYLIDVFTKDHFHYPNKNTCSILKRRFAEEYVPKLIEECEIFLQNHFEPSKSSIEIIANSDIKLRYFEDWIYELNISEAEIAQKGVFSTQSLLGLQYENLQSKKKSLIKTLIVEHKTLLHKKIDNFLTENKIDQIDSIEKIYLIRNELDIIENDCSSEYTDIIEKIKFVKQKINEAEIYIKEQILAKHYIVDTNVFVDCPDIINKIDNKHQIILSAKVIDELDNLKRKLKEDKKTNIEYALKLINQKLGKQKNIRTAKANLKILPPDFNVKSPDNFILSVALMYKDKNPVILTSDNGLHVKAKVLEIPTLSLNDFLIRSKYEKLTLTKNLPISLSDNKPINISDLIKAYEAVLKPGMSKVMMSVFNESLIKTIKGFSYKNYGFSKFVKFIEALSDIFEIEIDNKGTQWLKLKNI